MLITCKAMENTTRQFLFVSADNLYHFILSLATMNHKRQLCLYAPLHLLLKSIKLFFLKFARPIVVKSHLSDGYPVSVVDFLIKRNEIISGAIR